MSYLILRVSVFDDKKGGIIQVQVIEADKVWINLVRMRKKVSFTLKEDDRLLSGLECVCVCVVVEDKLGLSEIVLQRVTQLIIF